ncbi:MAG: leucyl/phenylalanyl-tRNA--protein transferase [Bacteriovoracaceae bacterium]
MNRVVIFPDVESATEDGLVAIGGDLEVDTLQAAYHKGIFPWPISVEFPLAWFSPNPRGVIDFQDIHLPRSFSKFLKKANFTVTYNTAFSEVIRNCATVHRKNQPTTWITPEIINGYKKLFANNLAYSVEVWREEKLVGGLYGVIMGDFISGESMFSLETNASKVGLYSLMGHLKGKGILWMDTQMVTSVVEGFGGKYISRPDFTTRLEKIDWTRKKSDFF